MACVASTLALSDGRCNVLRCSARHDTANFDVHDELMLHAVGAAEEDRLCSASPSHAGDTTTAFTGNDLGRDHAPGGAAQAADSSTKPQRSGGVAASALTSALELQSAALAEAHNQRESNAAANAGDSDRFDSVFERASADAAQQRGAALGSEDQAGPGEHVGAVASTSTNADSAALPAANASAVSGTLSQMRASSDMTGLLSSMGALTTSLKQKHGWSAPWLPGLWLMPDGTKFGESEDAAQSLLMPLQLYYEKEGGVSWRCPQVRCCCRLSRVCVVWHSTTVDVPHACSFCTLCLLLCGLYGTSQSRIHLSKWTVCRVKSQRRSQRRSAAWRVPPPSRLQSARRVNVSMRFLVSARPPRVRCRT